MPKVVCYQSMYTVSDSMKATAKYSILDKNGFKGPAFFLTKFLPKSLWASESFENSHQRV